LAITEQDFIEIGQRYGLSREDAKTLFGGYIVALNQRQTEGIHDEDLTREEVDIMMRDLAKNKGQLKASKSSIVELGKLYGVPEERAKEVYRQQRKEERGRTFLGKLRRK
jgi:hypothetical protein